MKRNCGASLVQAHCVRMEPTIIQEVLHGPDLPKEVRAAKWIISGGDLEACRSIGQI